MDRKTLIMLAFAWGVALAPLSVMAEPPESEVDQSNESPNDQGPSVESKNSFVESDDGDGDQASMEPTSQPATAPASPLPGPKYINLRADDDFSYLDGPPGSHKPDFFDPIKRIHLTDDLTLSIGGEARVMVHSLTNPGFGSNIPTQDTYVWQRYMLHTDFQYRKLLRVFVQGMDAEIDDQDFPLRPSDQDRFDVHQLFFDARVLGEKTPLTLRVGRQELQYGKQRLIAPLDWGNTRRSFDGVKLFYRGENWDVDAWYLKPVPIDLSEGLNRKPNEYREEQDFYGLYTTYKGIPNHQLDAYFLALVDDGNLQNANFKRGDLAVYTLGGRFGGKCGNFDYDGELAGQWGTFAGDRIAAWMAGTEAGYTFAQTAWEPRIGVGFDWGSGDRDSTDNTHGTFNQMFPLGHAYLGYLDITARQNIISPNINFTFKPLKNVSVKTAYMAFWNDSTSDALYNTGGAQTRRDRFRNPGHDIGNELDLLVNVQIDTHSSMLFGYSHFWASNFIAATGPSRDADFLYMGYSLKF